VITLDVDNPREVDLSTSYLRNNIQFSLRTLFGEIGAAIPFDVCDVLVKEDNSITSLISCPTPSLLKLRSALTLQSTYQGQDCCYIVKTVTNNLLTIPSL